MTRVMILVAVVAFVSVVNVRLMVVRVFVLKSCCEGCRGHYCRRHCLVLIVANVVIVIVYSDGIVVVSTDFAVVSSS